MKSAGLKFSQTCHIKKFSLDFPRNAINSYELIFHMNFQGGFCLCDILIENKWPGFLQ